MNLIVVPSPGRKSRWLQLCVYIMHRIISKGHSTTIFFYHSDHVFLKAAGTERIGQFFQNL